MNRRAFLAGLFGTVAAVSTASADESYVENGVKYIVHDNCDKLPAKQSHGAFHRQIHGKPSNPRNHLMKRIWRPRPKHKRAAKYPGCPKYRGNLSKRARNIVHLCREKFGGGGGGGFFSNLFGGGGGNSGGFWNNFFGGGGHEDHGGEYCGGYDPKCFMTGSLILMADGRERPIEELWSEIQGAKERGEDATLMIRTYFGRALPIQTIHRTVHRRRWWGWWSKGCRPVRIKADTFGPNLPHTDLSVTAVHALGVPNENDLYLIEAGALANGKTIVRENPKEDTLVFFHIVLEMHDIILANGMPAETMQIEGMTPIVPIRSRSGKWGVILRFLLEKRWMRPRDEVEQVYLHLVV